MSECFGLPERVHVDISKTGISLCMSSSEDTTSLSIADVVHFVCEGGTMLPLESETTEVDFATCGEAFSGVLTLHDQIFEATNSILFLYIYVFIFIFIF